MPKVSYVIFTRDNINRNIFKFTSDVERILREATIQSLHLIDDDYPNIRSFGYARIVFFELSVKMEVERLKQSRNFDESNIVIR